MFAATANMRLNNVVSSKPTYDVDKTTNKTLTEYIGALISVFLGLLGVIFVILTIYGGFTWMTAAGNEEKVSKAARIIKASVLGILIIIAIYALWVFVFKRIVSL
jgi:cytochrome bd-type quinol oxidase subunit 2